MLAAACEEAPAEAAPIAAAAPAVRVPVTPSASDVLSMVDESIMSEFLARQADVLDEIEKELLNVEDGTSDGDLTGLLRFFHTLKGESALLGMPHVAELCHATEDMMQSEPLAACVERLLDVKDWLRLGRCATAPAATAQPAPVMEIMARLKEIPQRRRRPRRRRSRLRSRRARCRGRAGGRHVRSGGLHRPQRPRQRHRSDRTTSWTRPSSISTPPRASC